MVRAAAKNHPSVAVVVDPARYDDVVAAASGGGFDLAARRCLAAAAFSHTAAYDTAVAEWTQKTLLSEDPQADLVMPPYAGLGFERAETLCYGENPHQAAALYLDQAASAGIAQAEQLHGKAMSYNNYVDADAALRAAYDYDLPAVAVVKHNNPCGVAVASPNAEDSIADAHRKAHACDPLSAYGGVVAANRTVTAAMAETLKGIFTEVVVAPGFEPAALEILQAKDTLKAKLQKGGCGEEGVKSASLRKLITQVADNLC